MADPRASPVFDVKEHVIQAAHIREYARATADSQDDDPLLLHVNQYTPKDAPTSPPRPGDVTIIGAHGNGFPKELYEPLWEDLYHEFQKRGIRIRSIYIADCAWQGRSGLLNESKLGNDPSWFDCARDISHVINTLRPQRPLFGIAHSFGAAALTHAALAHPRLFTSLVLLDPVIFEHQRARIDPIQATIRRRDVWPSRAAAAASFAKNPFYSSWDPRIFDRWIQHGLTDLPPPEQRSPGSGEASDSDSGRNTNPIKDAGHHLVGPPVRLTTSKHQEAFTFGRPLWPAFDPSGTHILHPSHIPDLLSPLSSFNPLHHPVYQPEPAYVFSRLPHLRPSTMYILGGQSNLPVTETGRTRTRITGTAADGSGGMLKGRVEEVVDPRSGHLIPMQNPAFCARHAARWWDAQRKAWEDEDRAFREWSERPAGDKAVAGEDWTRRLRRDTQKSKL